MVLTVLGYTGQREVEAGIETAAEGKGLQSPREETDGSLTSFRVKEGGIVYDLCITRKGMQRLSQRKVNIIKTEALT